MKHRLRRRLEFAAGKFKRRFKVFRSAVCLLLVLAMAGVPALPLSAAAFPTDLQYLDYTDSEVSATDTLKYALYVPDGYESEQYPVFTYLNGAGSRGTDKDTIIRNLAPIVNPLTNNGAYKSIVVIPQLPSSGQWVNKAWSNGSYSVDSTAETVWMKLYMSLLDYIEKTYNADTGREYIMGQSMGGYGTWDAISRYPDRFAAAVAMCGAGDPSKAALIKDIPIIALHGDADVTVPVSGSRDMAAALETAGGHYTYLEYPDVDHYVNRRLFEQPEPFLDWMFAQGKGQAATPFDKSALYQFDRNYYFNFNSGSAGWNLAAGTAFTVSGEQLKAPTANGSTSLYLIGDGTPDADVPLDGALFSCYMTYSTLNTVYGGGPMFNYVDSSHYWFVRIAQQSGGGISVDLYQVNGSASQKATNTAIASPGGRIACLAVAIDGKNVKVYVDNQLAIDYPADAPFPATGKAGIRWFTSSGTNTALIDDFIVAKKDKAAIGELTLSDKADYQVIQRDPAAKSARVEFLAPAAEENAAKVQFKVVNFAGGSDVVDWTDASVKGSAYSAALTVPQGGWYKTLVRSLNETGGEISAVSGTARWGVGINILEIGQSNMAGKGKQTPYVVADDRVASFLNETWQHLADPHQKTDNSVAGGGDGGSMAPSVGNALVAALGVPVGIIPAALDGANLITDSGGYPYWTKRTAADHYDRSTLYGNSIYRARAAGGIEFITMNQGENNVSTGTSKADYLAGMKTLKAMYAEDGFDVPILYCQLGGQFASSWTHAKDDVMTGIRAAQKDADDGSGLLMAASELGLDFNDDNLHFTTASQAVIGGRIANGILYLLGESSYYQGPEIIGAEYGEARDTIVVEIEHRGGADFTPDTGITGFEAEAGGGAVAVVSAEKRDASHIALTLADEVPEGTIARIRYISGLAPDVSGLVKDDSPLNLPLNTEEWLRVTDDTIPPEDTAFAYLDAPIAVISDDFSGAALDSAWTVVSGSFSLSGGQATAPSSGTNVLIRSDTLDFTDYVMEGDVTIDSIPAGSYTVGFNVGYNNATKQTYSAVYTKDSGWRIFKRPVGGGAPLEFDVTQKSKNGSFDALTAGTHHIIVKKTGGTVTITVDGTERLSATDAASATAVLTTGGAGLYAYLIAAKFDDIRVYQPIASLPAQLTGTSGDAAKVRVTFGAHSYETVPNPDGTWALLADALPKGEMTGEIAALGSDGRVLKTSPATIVVTASPPAGDANRIFWEDFEDSDGDGQYHWAMESGTSPVYHYSVEGDNTNHYMEAYVASGAGVLRWAKDAAFIPATGNFTIAWDMASVSYGTPTGWSSGITFGKNDSDYYLFRTNITGDNKTKEVELIQWKDGKTVSPYPVDQVMSYSTGADAVYDFRIIGEGGVAKFYVDGVQVGGAVTLDNVQDLERIGLRPFNGKFYIDNVEVWDGAVAYAPTDKTALAAAIAEAGALNASDYTAESYAGIAAPLAAANAVKSNVFVNQDQTDAAALALKGAIAALEAGENEPGEPVEPARVFWEDFEGASNHYNAPSGNYTVKTVGANHLLAGAGGSGSVADLIRADASLPSGTDWTLAADMWLIEDTATASGWSGGLTFLDNSAANINTDGYFMFRIDNAGVAQLFSRSSGTFNNGSSAWKSASVSGLSAGSKVNLRVVYHASSQTADFYINETAVLSAVDLSGQLAGKGTGFGFRTYGGNFYYDNVEVWTGEVLYTAPPRDEAVWTNESETYTEPNGTFVFVGGNSASYDGQSDTRYSGELGAVASWADYPPAGGNFEVYYWNPGEAGEGSATFDIKTTSKQWRKVIDMAAQAAGWVKVAVVTAEEGTALSFVAANTGTGALYADAVKLVPTSAAADAVYVPSGGAGGSTEPAILVNQLGYDTGKSKRATVPNVTDGLVVELVNALTGAVAWSGTAQGNVVDFTAFDPAVKTDYYLRLRDNPSVQSYEFTISKNWVEAVTTAQALEFMDQARSDAWTWGSNSIGWRDSHQFSFEMQSLVLMYMSNPSYWDRITNGIYRIGDTEYPELRVQAPDEPDIVWLIKFAATRYLDWGTTENKDLHILTKEQLAWFLYIYPQISQWVDEDFYERVRDFTISVWSKPTVSSNAQWYPVAGTNHNAFILQTVFGGLKGSQPPGHSIVPNLMMYEVLTRDGISGAAEYDPQSYWDAAFSNTEWLISPAIDINDPRYNRGQRMSEHVTLESLAYFAQMYPDDCPSGLTGAIARWADTTVARADNLWDTRKAASMAAGDGQYKFADGTNISADIWTGPAYATNSHENQNPAPKNEPGNIAGIQAIANAAARVIGDQDTIDRLKAIGVASIDDMFGRNPSGRTFFYFATEYPGRGFLGADKGWFTHFTGGAGVLINVPATIDASCWETSYPYDPSKAQEYTEGWVSYNAAWNDSIAYSAAADIRLDVPASGAVGETVTLKLAAPLNMDYQSVETGYVFVANPKTGERVKVTVTEDSADGDWFAAEYELPNAPYVTVSYGLDLFEVSEKITVTGYAAIAPESVELDRDSAGLAVGESLTLIAAVLPAGTDDKTLTWYSDDESVAKVDQNGKVTAVAEGTATVKAVSNADNALSDECVVVVTGVVFNNITATAAPGSLQVGKTATLSVTAGFYSDGSPADMTGAVYAFRAKPGTLSSVNPAGLVTAADTPETAVFIVSAALDGVTVEKEVSITVTASAPVTAAIKVQFEEMLDPSAYGTKAAPVKVNGVDIYTNIADSAENGYLKFEPENGVTAYSQAFDTDLWDKNKHGELTPGYYRITVSTKTVSNYGLMSFTLDGDQIGPRIDGTVGASGVYSPTVLTESVLITGGAAHEIVMTIDGKNASSTGYQMALDWISFEKVGEPIAETLTGTAALSPDKPKIGHTVTAALTDTNNTGTLA
ncbi:MAG: Ig-like domain-containing protein, partial [Clostridiales bacterium]|nr:Ig-like domain-containing protein [Clostridiales bacterium]